MTLVGWSQIALVLVLVVACSIPLSAFVARVFAGERNFLSPVFGPVERGFYRLAGVDPAREQEWYGYAIAMVIFSIAGFLSLYALQRLQNVLPFNPRGFDAVALQSVIEIGCRHRSSPTLVTRTSIRRALSAAARSCAPRCPASSRSAPMVMDST